jgi:hypothetical protein
MPLPALCNLVITVIGIGAKKQVIRSNAMTNIAFVTNVHSGRDRAKVNYPRNPMRSHGYITVIRAAVNDAVATHQASCPQPAGIGFVYLRPKAFGKGLLFLASLMGMVANSATKGSRAGLSAHRAKVSGLHICPFLAAYSRDYIVPRLVV